MGVRSRESVKTELRKDNMVNVRFGQAGGNHEEDEMEDMEEGMDTEEEEDDDCIILVDDTEKQNGKDITKPLVYVKKEYGEEVGAKSTSKDTIENMIKGAIFRDFEVFQAEICNDKLQKEEAIKTLTKENMQLQTNINTKEEELERATQMNNSKTNELSHSQEELATSKIAIENAKRNLEYTKAAFEGKLNSLRVKCQEQMLTKNKEKEREITMVKKETIKIRDELIKAKASISEQEKKITMVKRNHKD